MIPSRRVSTLFEDKVKKPAKHRSQLVSKLSEKPQKYAIWFRSFANFDRMEDSSNLTSWNDRRRHRIRKRQSSWIRCMGIVEGRIRGKLRAEEVGFVSRRASYRAIRTN